MEPFEFIRDANSISARKWVCNFED